MVSGGGGSFTDLGHPTHPNKSDRQWVLVEDDSDRVQVPMRVDRDACMCVCSICALMWSFLLAFVAAFRQWAELSQPAFAHW